MSKLRFTCDGCGNLVTVDVRHAGGAGTCARCHRRLVVPCPGRNVPDRQHAPPRCPPPLPRSLQQQHDHQRLSKPAPIHLADTVAIVHPLNVRSAATLFWGTLTPWQKRSTAALAIVLLVGIPLLIGWMIGRQDLTPPDRPAGVLCPTACQHQVAMTLAHRAHGHRGEYSRRSAQHRPRPERRVGHCTSRPIAHRR